MTMKLKRGICKACGCTYEKPCIDKFYNTCAWANKKQTLCTFCKAITVFDKKKVKTMTADELRAVIARPDTHMLVRLAAKRRLYKLMSAINPKSAIENRK